MKKLVYYIFLISLTVVAIVLGLALIGFVAMNPDFEPLMRNFK